MTKIFNVVHLFYINIPENRLITEVSIVEENVAVNWYVSITQLRSKPIRGRFNQPKVRSLEGFLVTEYLQIEGSFEKLNNFILLPRDLKEILDQLKPEEKICHCCSP